MDRVSVFIDGANFFFMQKDGLGWFADPKKLLDFIEAKYGTISDAFYYIGKDAPPDARQQGFLDALPEMGFSVVSKQIKTIYDAKTGTTKKKANLDIEIVLDMFNTIDSYDIAVLVSGDGDFDRALQLLKARGKRFVKGKLHLMSHGYLNFVLMSVLPSLWHNKVSYAIINYLEDKFIVTGGEGCRVGKLSGAKSIPPRSFSKRTFKNLFWICCGCRQDLCYAGGRSPGSKQRDRRCCGLH